MKRTPDSVWRSPQRRAVTSVHAAGWHFTNVNFRQLSPSPSPIWRDCNLLCFTKNSRHQLNRQLSPAPSPIGETVNLLHFPKNSHQNSPNRRLWWRNLRARPNSFNNENNPYDSTCGKCCTRYTRAYLG